MKLDFANVPHRRWFSITLTAWMCSHEAGMAVLPLQQLYPASNTTTAGMLHNDFGGHVLLWNFMMASIIEKQWCANKYNEEIPKWMSRGTACGRHNTT
ncbi:hypothetical protein E2C01_049962 [Portunus trituberculatus]|uniref:Uncharacterized protein n=1 Tax=Portunus trituberculatus TaxID=210409 RepID=A0A5B7GAT9_PORTR|nr:hypothetical protein [Portunus trituberculatus]